jgi:hypothetical protein
MVSPPWGGEGVEEWEKDTQVDPAAHAATWVLSLLAQLTRGVAALGTQALPFPPDLLAVPCHLLVIDPPSVN